MRQYIITLATVASTICGSCNAFTTAPSPLSAVHIHITDAHHYLTTPLFMSSASDDAPANLVSQDEFVKAIDVIKADMVSKFSYEIITCLALYKS